MRATGPPRSHPHQSLRLDRSGSPRGGGTCFDPLRPASVSLPPLPSAAAGRGVQPLAEKGGAGPGQRFPWARYIAIQLQNTDVIQRSSEDRRSSTAAVRESTPPCFWGSRPPGQLGPSRHGVYRWITDPGSGSVPSVGISPGSEGSGLPSPSREPPGGRDARSGRRGSHRL